ncbi:uncharacterized protein UTRI_02962 [Ustilago trichophora]|uniref:Uncharacterized protein n=1 Tax=Ustilago trichophora TaxID=86804 RepID=A0A5C3ER07_9BASI|nr:uncharacterized protein UTRI_02962 [Ustilago trichophora]
MLSCILHPFLQHRNIVLQPRIIAEQHLAPPSPRTAASFKTAPPPATSEPAKSISTSLLVSSASTCIQAPMPSSTESSPPSPVISSTFLKTYKSALRILITTLTTIETELILLDRIWYKNASQFKSALWWNGVDGARRSLHKLFLPTTITTAVGGGSVDSGLGLSLGKSTLRNCILIYSAIAGGMEAFQTQQFKFQQDDSSSSSSWPTIPKFNTKPLPPPFPSVTTISQLLCTSQSQLESLQVLLKEVQRRLQNAGKILVRHLNTPPAPTFAPLVTACLGALGCIDAELNRVLAKEEDRSTVELLQHLLNRLSKLKS